MDKPVISEYHSAPLKVCLIVCFKFLFYNPLKSYVLNFECHSDCCPEYHPECHHECHLECQDPWDKGHG